ncbi:MAG: response regulator [Acholeplasmataceae bacterium]|jgi:diguanylate cyclase (GGDEF)-like protein|nr:response regulator [Acholeplasmataceae bacterium]
MEKSNHDNMKTKNIMHLGPFVVDKKWAYNCYLLNVSDYFVLFDITPLHKYDLLKVSIEKYTSIQHIKLIVLQYIHISTLNVLIELIDDGFKGKILTNKYFGRQLKNAHLNVEIIEIEDINYKYTIGKNDYLQFYPMSYLPFPQMFLTYTSINNSFFSSSLLSSYYIDEKATPDVILKSMFQFHYENTPSSLYIKPILDILKQTRYQAIYPLFGYVIQYDLREQAIDYLYKHDFYNSNQYSTKYLPLEEQHIYECLDHSLVQLSKYFSKRDIMDMFIGSPFHLQQDELKLKKSTLEGYKLYHGFFEYIYAKKGLLWLSVLEPIINRYMETYKIEQPSIYRSLVLQMNIEKDHLEKKRIELEEGLSHLKDEYEKVKENALRCPFTGLYYQNVMVEMMEHEKSKERDYLYGVLLIQLDQLIDFNKRYGKETGNESIRNMAYVIQNILSNEQYLYKQYGPGIYLFDAHATKDSMKKLAQTIKNEISQSNIFIEKVSVSISSVLEDEVSKDIPIVIQINSYFDLLEKRMILLKDANSVDIKDESTSKSIISEGKILLVDEDEMNRNMLFRIFKRLNYEVVLAQSVEQALELIKIYPIDLIISEINLSKIDGFQLKQMLNEYDAYEHIPFFMISHNKTIENIKRGNALDVDLIMQKPIIAEELIGHIKRFRERRALK